MIDEITLAAWEKNVREGAYTSVHYVGDRLQEAIAEIRRLQKLNTPELLDENQALMD